MMKIYFLLEVLIAIGFGALIYSILKTKKNPIKNLKQEYKKKEYETQEFQDFKREIQKQRKENQNKN